MKTVIIENKEQVEEIISRCDICFVGITDLEGNPYVIPMNFGYQDGVIYLHSGPTGSSIDMLARNNRVCITFSVDHELVFPASQSGMQLPDAGQECDLQRTCELH